MKIFNILSGKEKRKSLRKNMPKAEVVLLSRLKGKQSLGLKFRRQYGVGKYVVDFYCPKLKLAIELDGESHFLAGKPVHDRLRQSFIESKGIRFLRFTNNDIFQNLAGVLRTIEDFIENYPSLRVSPPCTEQGGEV